MTRRGSPFGFSMTIQTTTPTERPSGGVKLWMRVAAERVVADWALGGWVLGGWVSWGRVSWSWVLGAALVASADAQGGAQGSVRASHAGSAPGPPNIVMVIADDLGYGDLGCYGNTQIATPALDALAQNGLKSTAFYVSPSCSPTRAALMTGAYHARVDVLAPLGAWADRGMATEEVTIAEVLQGAGYRTGFFGKWHLGDSPDQLPGAQGFDEAFVTPWGLPARPHALFDTHGPDEMDSDPVGWTPRFLDRTLAFMDAAHATDTPFFAILSHSSPHLPATPSPDFVGVSADGREYGDAVEEIDASVAVLNARLAELGITENTFVMFFSDNGPALGQGAYQAGSAGPLSGGKGTTSEGGVRVPFVAAWPARIPAGTVSEAPIHCADLFETLAAVCGVPLPASLPERDGVNIVDVLVGGAGDPFREVHHFAGSVLDAVRIGRWKLRRGELFDLVSDPAERHDLAPALPNIVGILNAAIADRATAVEAGTRDRGPTLRRTPEWNGGIGFNGTSWRERRSRATSWLVLDQDPLVDLEAIPTGASALESLPGMALRLGRPGTGLTLERDGVDLEVAGAGAPFGLEFWVRSGSEDPGAAAVLFDAGDSGQGLSITIGDGGIRGDDAAAGRRDDLRVRVGGSASPRSTTVTFDLPSGERGWAEEFVHVAITYDGSILQVYCNAQLAGEAGANFLASGLNGRWSLFDRQGSLGGAAGPGTLPFNGERFIGDVAGVAAFDRALARKEVEILVCRHVAYAYCAPVPTPSGRRFTLDLAGDFRPGRRDIEALIGGVPPGSFGALFASREQTRLPARGGYFCVDTRFAAGFLQPQLVGGGGQVPPLTGSVGGFTFNQALGTAWNFQVWIRTPTGSGFTNAMHVLFCP